MRDLVLATEGVSKRFGGIVALDNVAIRVPRESVVLLIGPNGSGKTTLVNVITGFIKPDKGRVYYKGLDITGLEPHKIARLGLVRTFQIPRAFLRLTVLENVLLAAKDHPGESPWLAPFFRSRWLEAERRLVERAMEILEWVNLDHSWDKRASELSGGQLKLLEIARALMSGAETIIMDEPAAGVNPKLAHEIFTRIRWLAKTKGVTFLIIEHRIDIAAEYSDYAYAMHLGRIISEGKPSEVLSDPRVFESYLGG